MTDHWFDRFARRVAEDRLSRREVLASGGRTLAAGALGSGLGLLEALPPARASGDAPAGPRPSASQCSPLEQERCCTTRAVHSCARSVTGGFRRALGRCRTKCLAPDRQGCTACRKAAAHHTLAQFKACLRAKCLTMVEPQPTPRATLPTDTAARTAAAAPRSSQHEHPRSGDPAESCSYVRLANCEQDADLIAAGALAACAVACIFLPPTCAALPACVGAALNAYIIKTHGCIRDYGCGGLSFCTGQNICCGLRETPCDKVCCGSDQTCDAGVCGCGGQSCGSPDSCCDGHCVNTQSDPHNCGGCGGPCGDGTCENGMCVCPPGQTLCFDGCFDTNSDPDHCGGCGLENRCGPNAYAPQQNNMCCSGQCVDANTDTGNCGDCGAACGPGQGCNEGQCTCTADTDCPELAPYCCNGVCASAACGTEACAPGFSVCGTGPNMCCPPGAGPCCPTQTNSAYGNCCHPGFFCNVNVCCENGGSPCGPHSCCPPGASCSGNGVCCPPNC